MQADEELENELQDVTAAEIAKELDNLKRREQEIRDKLHLPSH